jgi:hypothetical protein
MSERRKRKRYYIDAGDGITLGTTLRSPPDPKTEEALKALARAAAKHMQDGRAGVSSSPEASE